MTKIMNAFETITDGQIKNVVSKVRDAMRKHRAEISSDIAQRVLGIENLGMMMFAPFRERAEGISNLIVRKVKVSRNRTPQEALDATSRRQYTDRVVVDSMPKGEREQVKVVFFKPDLSQRDGYISDADLEKEFKLRGLTPADPFSLSAVNEADPAFADEHPNATHWQDTNGKWCYAAFGRWDGGEREVNVRRDDYDWDDYWWFAGLAS